MLSRFVAATVAAFTIGQAAHAADLPPSKGPPPVAAPTYHCTEKNAVSIDIFGFTTGSDVNDPAALSGSLTYFGAFDTRGGTFRGHQGVAQLSYGLAPCLEVGPYVSALTARTNIFAAPPEIDASAYAAGLEMKYKLLSRSLHGVGLTVVVDPSVARNQVDLLPNFTSYNVGLRLFLDAELVAGKLFGAVNISHDMTSVKSALLTDISTLTLAGALSWQFADGVFLGGEVRHLRRYNSFGCDAFAGHGTFIGPTAFWQVSKTVSVSGAWNVQVTGKTEGLPGNLDLVNFNRHLVKGKLAVAF